MTLEAASLQQRLHLLLKERNGFCIELRNGFVVSLLTSGPAGLLFGSPSWRRLAMTVGRQNGQHADTDSQRSGRGEQTTEAVQRGHQTLLRELREKLNRPRAGHHGPAGVRQ